MTEPNIEPVSDAFLRAAVIRLLHEIISDEQRLKKFSGQLWLTYQQGRRLTPVSVSGSIGPNVTAGRTFPEILGLLAAVLGGPHGHVLCHEMLAPGFTGAITIGHSVFWDPHAQSVLPPQAMLVAIIVQLDGREKTLVMDPRTGVAEDLDFGDGMPTLVANTWAIIETIHNMSNAPLTANALKYATEILNVQPGLELGVGRRLALSGTHVLGSPSGKVAAGFLERAAAAAKAAQDPAMDPLPTGRKHRRFYLGQARDVVAEYSKPEPDMPETGTRYRTVD